MSNLGNYQQNEFAYLSHDSYGQTHQPSRQKKSRTVLKVLLFIIALLIIIAAFVGYNGYQLYKSAQTVKAQASVAMADLSDVKANIAGGDMAAAQKAAQHLTATAKSMKEETSSNLWVAAEKIPVYGDDIVTARTLVAVLEDVSENALEPLCVQLSDFSLQSLMGDDGSVNVEEVSSIVNKMSDIAPVLERDTAAFNNCPKPHIEELKNLISKASSELNATNNVFSFAYRFAPLVPNVFGANEARKYFVVAQNNVEARCTGGFYGSAGVLTIDNGKMSMSDFSSLRGSSFDNAYISYDLSSAYERIGFIYFPGSSLSNMGGHPDFPHVAQVLSDACYYEGTPVSGVILVDPIFLQYLIGLTGGFSASDGTWVDGSNAATIIMHDTYWNYVNDDAAQDVFFTMIANDAMEHVFSSLKDLDFKELIKTAEDGIEKRHLSIWFNDPDEEAAIAELGLDGSVSTDPEEAVTGIYFGNDSWSKMEWYLRATPSVTGETKNADGSTSYSVSLSLSNVISDEEAWSGNWYVVAGNGHGHHQVMYQPADMLESVLLLAPAGGSIQNLETDADVYNGDTGTICGNDAIRTDIHLLPGETVTFTYTVVTSPKAKGDLQFDMTPLAQDVQ